MGVEEYEFLTRTMEKIELISSKLADEKKQLSTSKGQITKKRKVMSAKEEEIRNNELTIAGINTSLRTEDVTTFWSDLSAAGSLPPAPVRLTKEGEPDKRYKHAAEFGQILFENKVDIFLKSLRRPLERTRREWYRRKGLEKSEALLVAPILFLFIWLGVGMVLWVVIFIYDVGGFVCDNGNHIPHILVNSMWGEGGSRLCDDFGSEGNGGWPHKGSVQFAFGCFVLTMLTIVRWVKPTEHNEEAKNKIDEIESELRILESEGENLLRIKKLEESILADSQSVRGMEHSLRIEEQGVSDRKKTIKRIEEEIPPLWDSIAHLIPYSSALEKA